MSSRSFETSSIIKTSTENRRQVFKLQKLFALGFSVLFFWLLFNFYNTHEPGELKNGKTIHSNLVIKDILHMVQVISYIPLWMKWYQLLVE
jgi:hypothetical protein